MPRDALPAALSIAALRGTCVLLTGLAACGDGNPGIAPSDAGAETSSSETGIGIDTGVVTDSGFVDSGVNKDASADTFTPTDATPSVDAALSGWTLTWSDEFNAPDGSGIDPTKWSFDVGTGGDGWGNSELEYYTDGTKNAVILGGALVITAKTDGASSLTCSYGPCQFTSARLHTQGKFEQKYGRFEARIKVPTGSGTWPAFWMLGNDIATNDWPACGEIDIMETVGLDPRTVHGTTHGPGGSVTYTDQGISGAYSLPATGPTLGDDFHLYAVEWSSASVAFSIDGDVYETVVPPDLPAGATWVFDHPYFLLLNFAVGGDWPGSPSPSEPWPKTMVIDYVRAYEPAP
ncbi:MAG: family 16 glycosylhydrolase [Polyangiales bacterium]